MMADNIEFGGAPHRLRGWLLFILEEAGRAGLAPISQERLHLLLFYSAVLTPVLKLDTPVPKILKYQDRPFYPEAQEALESFVVRGFIEGSGRSNVRDKGWSAEYVLTPFGSEAAAALRQTRWGKEVSSFAHDLVDGFAELNPSEADEIITQDETFRAGRMDLWEVRDLRKRNEAEDAAKWVADYDVDGFRPKPRDSIALYFEYLQARRAA